MKKLFLFFAAMLVTLTVNATVINISPTSPKDADNLRLALSSSTEGDTIVMAAGTYVESNSDYIAFKRHNVVMAAKDAEVIIKPHVSFRVRGGARAELNGVKIDASELTSLGSYENIFEVGDATAGNCWVLKNCEVYGNSGKTLLRHASDKTLDSLIIDGCYVHNNPQAILRLQSTTLKGVIIKNSTFAEIANGGSFWCAPMDISKTAEDAKVVVDQCTFYHNTSISSSYADITTGYDGSATSNVVVSNCIIAQPEAYAGSRAINFTNGGVVKNCLVFNYTKSTNGIQGASSVDNCIYVDPLFADAENANYTLDEENSPAKGAGLGGTHLGDPRWWPASWQPAEVIDVTGIELDKSEISLEVNEVELLSATVSPDDATDPTVFWSSSDASVATISGGFITAKAAGSATITATAGEKEATCAVTVVAATVPEVDFASACELTAKKARLEGKVWKMYKDETYKLYGDGASNKQYGDAFWTINVTHPCIVTGVLNGVEGGHLFVLDLYKGEELIGYIAQPAAKVWGAGEIALDSVDHSTLTFPEAGNYTLKLRNTQEWSSGKVAGVTLTFESELPQTLYLKPGIWYNSGNQEKFAIYAFEDGMPNYWSDYMSLVEGEEDIWSTTIPGEYSNVVFVRFGSASTTPSWDDNMWNQTNDLTIEEGKDMYTITLSTWEGHEGKCPGEWSKYVFEGPAKYYITGMLGSWDAKAIKSTTDSYTFENLPIGSYAFKVLPTGDWSLNKGYDDLTEQAKGLSPDEDRNVCFKMREVGDITVTYTDEVFTVEGDFYVQRLENDFYLVGEFNGEEKWSPAAIDENYRFVWNSGEGDKAEFKVVADLTVGDKLKAVYIYEDEIVDWYPDGSDNEYVVDALHDGAGKTVYFRKDYSGTDWGHNLYIDQRAPKTYYGVDTFTTGGAVINPSVWRVLEWSITRNANKTLTFNISWNEDITGIVPQLNLGGFKNMAVTGYSASLTTEATYEDGAELTPEFYLAYAGAASSIPVSYTVGAENEKPNAPVGNLEINFMTDPKTIISGNGVLPTGVEIEGTWHGDSHGYNGAKVTMYVVAGNYKITVGNCQYSNNSASAYIKNADESAALNLIDANGQTISSITAKDGCYHQKPSEKIESAWFVAEEAQTIKFIGAEYTPYLKFEKVESVPEAVTVYNVTFVNLEEDVEGTLPAAQLIVDGESLTIPVNRTLYKEGYTLTGWSDGVETFEAGQQFTPTKDVTLTAVFTANGADLLTFTQDITVQWDLTQKAGAPAVTWQNREGDFIVTQAIAGGARLDVKLDINTKPGKFAPQADWCQVNAGTTFTFPSKKDATFEVRSYVDPATSTLDGNAYNGSWVNSIATFSTTNTSGTSVYVSNESDQYYSYFKLTLPKTTATAIDNANANAKATKSIVNGMLIIEKNGKIYNVLGTEIK